MFLIYKSLSTNETLISSSKIDIQNARMASGQEGSHWLIESPTLVHLRVTRPSEISVNFVFKHIHAFIIYTMCR